MASAVAYGFAEVEPIQFIDLTARSAQASEQNRHLIRSHIAKNNRRKRTQLAAQRTGSHKRLIAPLQSLRQDDGGDVPAASDERSSEHASEERPASEISLNDLSNSPPLLDLAPSAESCGAFSAVAAAGDMTSFGESARYMLEVIMPNAFVPPLAWFEVFCQEPLVYHAFASVRNLELVSSGSNALVNRQRMLFHKGEAIRMLNDKLSHVETDDIETILIGMLTVFPEEQEVVKASALAPTLFIPHIPWANNTTIYAGVDPQGLRRAIQSLVAQAGGLLNLQKIQMMPKTIAKADLLLASSIYTKPLFPWLWPVHPSELNSNHGSSIVEVMSRAVTTAFDTLSGLPATARWCFNALAQIDQAMARTRTHRLQSLTLDLDLLVTARDTIHHQLLSLPSWRDLVVSQEEDVDEFVYECCRLISILYMHCVIAPLLPGCPGITHPLAALRSLLDINQHRFQEPNLVAMTLWSLLIGGLAGFRTQHRDFFVQMLQQLLVDHHISSMQSVLNMARTFIWSDSACLQGASVIWDFMGLLPSTTTPMLIPS